MEVTPEQLLQSPLSSLKSRGANQAAVQRGRARLEDREPPEPDSPRLAVRGDANPKAPVASTLRRCIGHSRSDTRARPVESCPRLRPTAREPQGALPTPSGSRARRTPQSADAPCGPARGP